MTTKYECRGYVRGAAFRERELPPAAIRDRRRRGFTLIEVLIVVSILAALFGLAITGTGSYMGKASEKATVSVVVRVQSWMDEYRSLTGFYPPDGLDSRERTKEDRTELRGSGALYYHLTRRVVAEELIGSRRRLRDHPAVAQISGSETIDEHPDYPGVHEIRDGYGNPFHYDNTTNGKYRPQDGSVHYHEIEEADHPEDPREGTREIDGKPVVRRTGIQSPKYDFWSHGAHGHDPGEEPSMPIATWNIRSFD